MKRNSKAVFVPAVFETLPVFTALFALGIAFSAIIKGMAVFALLICLTCLVASFLSLPERHKILILCLGSLGAGIFYGATVVKDHDFSDFRKLDGTKGLISGTFIGEYRTLRGGGVSLKLSSVIYEFDDQKVSIPGLIQCQAESCESIPDPEQSYSVEGRFISPEPGSLPVFKGKNLLQIENHAYLNKLAGKLQRKIRDGLNTVLPHRHASIVIGFILGDTSRISREDRQLFRETGISHLLAVSGQHVMVLIMVLAAILHWLNVPPVSRSLLMIAVLTGYALTTSGSPSVWRALIMYICVAAILHLEAFPSPVIPVSGAALLVLLHNPAMLFNAAFQLSFTAVLSIIMFRPPLEALLSWLKIPETPGRYFAVTFAANFGTMPMTAFLFGTVSASALLVNPLLLWSFGYILPVAFLIAFLSFIMPAAAIWIAPGLTLVLDGFIQCLELFRQMPGSYFYVGNLSGLTIATIYSLMLFLAAKHNQHQVSACLPATESDSHSSMNKPASITANASINKIADQEKETDSYSEYYNRHMNILRNSEAIDYISASLQKLGRRALKNSNSETGNFPVNLLSLENQNLYYQLIDLDRKALKSEPARVLQAQIYLMALIGNEILNRISFHLKPPPGPEDLKIDMIIRERHLATTVLTDSLLSSSLLTRATDQSLMMIISRAQIMFTRARNQIERIILQKNSEDTIDQHLSLRRDMLIWCQEFINFDLRCKKQQTSGLRGEQ